MQPKSNWNKIATWYDSLVGSEGHRYHQQYAIPTVLKMLEIQQGETILDIGCGQGALAPYVYQKGGKYFGVDISPEMINNALKRHGKEGKFAVSAATKLSQASQDINFESAVFLLSLQDMDHLDKAIYEASLVLKNNGKLVIFMLHPAFRIPRQSGWGEDKKRKLIYRRVDRYKSESTIPLDTNVKEKGRGITSFFYHRPLQDYFDALNNSGFKIDKLTEIYEEGKQQYSEFPMFLALRAIKG